MAYSEAGDVRRYRVPACNLVDGDAGVAEDGGELLLGLDVPDCLVGEVHIELPSPNLLNEPP